MLVCLAVVAAACDGKPRSAPPAPAPADAAVVAVAADAADRKSVV